ncbi:hypothetical protein YPPY66_2572 [Yersinia pestis PY-66]|uniref:Uncharacterized protein n=2 Tax=Yersinia pseudotuberculosis complex TaxID=1649845 RepID=A0A0U1QVU5_YERP3|nr:hypothetical protein YpsIP31758_2083 [Yersinia pseudotuberculosis IP 31758]ABX87613.1 hypothetical protein YpAngola_A2479 [Yersinia pestis Angola]EDR44050.1 hypothetical protein YpE1979001_0376 [Yersinia pestis biovar Antiqua str. E1979001]EDR52431.1 hypothetical protein YpB42003004_1399 [Yersinia pestis biovar Antiqua str. B42003004]EDR60583.1 hypothetical protein YpUG050454_0153 [Yersinia pestis biovar Antiqua str. UG05-0454]EDR66192.1 hypothetical protein YpK1973002_3947 [Yersinia pestis
MFVSPFTRQGNKNRISPILAVHDQHQADIFLTFLSGKYFFN